MCVYQGVHVCVPGGTCVCTRGYMCEGVHVCTRGYMCEGVHVCVPGGYMCVYQGGTCVCTRGYMCVYQGVHTCVY